MKNQFLLLYFLFKGWLGCSENFLFFIKASERKAECNHQVHKMLVAGFLPSEHRQKGWPVAYWDLL